MVSSLLAPLLFGAITATEPTAPARAELDALLAKPVSPGVIALLVGHLPETRAAERVIASLAHADPAVRAAAARVVYVTGLSGAGAAVRAALEAETDRSAAVEQLRAATLGVLTGGEPALRAIAERHRVVAQLARAMGTATPASPPPAWRSSDEYARIMIAGGLPPGLLRDLLAVTGCKADPDLRAPAIVIHRPDGRPRQVSMAAKLLSSGCAEAAGPALGLTLAPSGFLDPAYPDRRSIVIIPLNEGALECADQPEPSIIERAPDEKGGKAKITEPRKLKNVPPHYPMAAREARRQGTVVLEASITESGCVRSARVVQGVAPDLDLAAMISVSQWRYTPTPLDGKPVTVLMTITVNFRLR